MVTYFPSNRTDRRSVSRGVRIFLFSLKFTFIFKVCSRKNKQHISISWRWLRPDSRVRLGCVSFAYSNEYSHEELNDGYVGFSGGRNRFRHACSKHTLRTERPVRRKAFSLGYTCCADRWHHGLGDSFGRTVDHASGFVHRWYSGRFKRGGHNCAEREVFEHGWSTRHWIRCCGKLLFENEAS